MGTAKLMTPLFYDGNYNVEKKRMRAVLEREVSNGTVSYRLWRSDGKPDLFDQGYRIFLHFKSGTVTEVGRGENPALPVRIIRENMNLEAPLLAGLLGKLTE